MTATNAQPKVRRERRIIERPRLIKLLDECEARIILLLAPAGYGKTTLARQWAKTLNGAIWISCTPAHRDVVTFAEDLAMGIDGLGGDSTKILREHVSAQANPQRAGQVFGRALAAHLVSTPAQWLIVDDLHEISGSSAEELLDVLREEGGVRLLISSRARPSWARARALLYGEINELTRDALAMTDAESAELLGHREALASLVRKAEGWPAVLTLALAAKAPPPLSVLPSALHQYLAEELFQEASPALRDHLVRLALLPPLNPMNMDRYFGAQAGEVTIAARDLGFASGEETLDLHPLVRDFLIEKLTERRDAAAQVHEAIEHCLEIGAHERALQLVSHFRVDDQIEPVLRRVFKPLVRSGRIGTLSAFASEIRRRPSFPPPAVDVVEAEVALRDGQLLLAKELGDRARRAMPIDHPLRSRASAIVGHSTLLCGHVGEAEAAFLDARLTAHDHLDETEAMYGVALAKTTGEQSDAKEIVNELRSRRHESPTLLVRSATAELAHRRFSGGIGGHLRLDEARHALSHVEDPRVRSYFSYLVAYTLGQRADYREGREWVSVLMSDVEQFDLEFARPHALWTSALLTMGLRKFGEAERSLQALEDAVASGNHSSHRINAQALRARLSLQTGKLEVASENTSDSAAEQTYPSWVAEHIATRALVLACLGDSRGAESAAASAEAGSRVVEVRMLAAAARAVVRAQAADPAAAQSLFNEASRLGAWDPVVCALRCSQELSDLAAADPSIRTRLESLYLASNDLGLARRAGFRTRVSRSPAEVLSPRESEVLGLIAGGMRNREIAATLFISQSTAKVHVKHVLEKLGVRTRAEAVARYEMFAAAASTRATEEERSSESVLPNLNRSPRARR